jgi:hypothetical protein
MIEAALFGAWPRVVRVFWVYLDGVTAAPSF